MFTIRNLVEQYTNRKAEVLQKSYSEVINSTSLCIIFCTNNGTRIFLDMHPEAKYVRENPEYNYELPNTKNVFRKFTFEIVSNSNTIFTNGINWVKQRFNCLEDYRVNTPISEKKFNEFISDNGGIDTEELTKNIYELYPDKNIV